MQKWLASLVLPLLGAACLVLAVIILGRGALSQLRDQDRYALAFGDISCMPPPGLGRAEFLGEVQFLAAWPDRLHLLDAGLPKQLAEAFARHPWVERVDRIAVASGAVHIDMTYRVPVLAVPRPGADGPLRAVDGHGVLLPLAALVAGLPILEGAVSPPGEGTGLPWGDAQVEAAAATAAALRPYQQDLRIEKMQVRAGEVWLQRVACRIRWGRPPGQEIDGEASAKVKIQKLLHEIGRAQGPDSAELDLRK